MIYGQDSQGQPFQQFVVADISVAPFSAFLTGEYNDTFVDTDVNGQVDTLEVGVGVTILTGGTYKVIASLTPSRDPDVIERISAEAELIPGQNFITLHFDSQDVSRVQNYHLRDVVLFDMTPRMEGTQGMQIDTDAGDRLDSRNAGDLERDAIIILPGTIQDEGIDDDGDGRFDVLRFTLDIDVAESGTYRAQATLVDREGNTLALLDLSDYYSSGTHTLALDVDGETLSRYGTDGPYTLLSLSIQAEEDASVMSDVVSSYTTRAYSNIQFEGGVGKRWHIFLPQVQR
jgi:hypothetical protein